MPLSPLPFKEPPYPVLRSVVTVSLPPAQPRINGVVRQLSTTAALPPGRTQVNNGNGKRPTKGCVNCRT